MIRAAELMGIHIPWFCQHPLLDPVGACRQCIVEIEGQRKPMTSCTVVGHRRHGGAYPAGRRRSPTRRSTWVMELLLDQPSAGLSDVRQGRRVPAAEPGNVQRTNREARFHDDKRHFAKPINVFVAGAARSGAVHFVRALHPVLRSDRRRQIHRRAGARCAAADRHLRQRAVRLVLLGQHGADLPGGRADRNRLPFPGPPLRPGVEPQRLRTLRVRVRPAHRPPARQGAAPAGRRRPRGQRGVELRQGPGGCSPTRRSRT